ncbi:MAG: DNA/RNA nuclease SfsA [Pseudomonadales bacterium]
MLQYDKELIPATLIKRYKRFLADVVLEDGTEKTVHCANTGAMTGCAIPQSRVWLYPSDNPKRKYANSWELVEQTQPAGFICINTARANQVVEEALLEGRVASLAHYSNVRREVKYGEGSRVDFLLSQDGHPDVYVEVKSVTLHLHDELGAFPDAVTTRGQKHLQELQRIVEGGERAVLLFCVMHTGIREVQTADHIDARYAQLFTAARAAGVEVLVYGCDISTDGIALADELPLRL